MIKALVQAIKDVLIDPPMTPWEFEKLSTERKAEENAKLQRANRTLTIATFMIMPIVVIIILIGLFT